MSKLAILDKYKDATATLQNVSLSEEYWIKDAALQDELTKENNFIQASIMISYQKLHMPFTL